MLRADRIPNCVNLDSEQVRAGIVIYGWKFLVFLPRDTYPCGFSADRIENLTENMGHTYGKTTLFC